MARSFSAEFRLAAACAMWPPSDRRTEAIGAAAAGPLDWPRFLRVAQRHRVLGLAHQGLTEARLAVPPEIRREIGARAATLVRENLAMAAEALRLQRLFDEAHLPVLFVKGSSLAMLAFGNLGLSGGAGHRSAGSAGNAIRGNGARCSRRLSPLRSSARHQ